MLTFATRAARPHTNNGPSNHVLVDKIASNKAITIWYVTGYGVDQGILGYWRVGYAF